jgi:hypothetical protein
MAGLPGSLEAVNGRSDVMAEVKDRRTKHEEDLSEGPTPRIRREMGEPKQEHDTSEGPTPETREAERVGTKK